MHELGALRRDRNDRLHLLLQLPATSVLLHSTMKLVPVFAAAVLRE
jgi:hypothetical protein